MAMLLVERNLLRNVTPLLLEQSAKYSSKSYDDYQFIHHSEIPTMHYQSGLPRLPIPKLEKTCERYLNAQKPLIHIPEAYAKTEANVKRFLTSSGKLLNNILIENDKKNKHTSYISGPWFDMYLKDRIPLPINYNPFLIHLPGPNRAYETQPLKATNLLISSLRFLRALRENILKPEIFFLDPKTPDNPMFSKIAKALPSKLAYMYTFMNKGYALDMSQYRNLFNTTRIPELDKDLIAQNENARHVVVMRNGHFYIFDVLNANGEILPAETLYAKILKVLSDNRPPATSPLGILTTQNRNDWASTRHLLLKLGNDRTLRKIDTALFNLVLDDVELSDDKVQVLRHYLHGDGRNRWFDKSFSLIVTKDARSGVNFEHSWGDGVAVLRYFNDIWKDSTRKPQVHPETTPDPKVTMDDVQYLEINLDNQVKDIIKTAMQKYDETCQSLDLNVLEFDGVGKKLCKKSSVSPDAIMQLGFQCAYFKLAGKFIASYESCSTAAFKHGRTETIRPCTMATKDFCDALYVKKVTNNSELRSKIQECSEIHSNLTKEAAMGQGFDRHLFALKYTAAKIGRPTPSIFGDPEYSAINHNIISTSTLSSPTLFAGGFGPTVHDGYGIGYNIQDDHLGVLVTSYRDGASGADYVNSLRKSYQEIRDILSKE